MQNLISAKHTLIKTFGDYIKYVFALIMAFITYLVGDLSSAIISTIILFIVLDTITGVLNAKVSKIKITSEKMTEGIVKIVVYLIFMTLAHHLPKINLMLSLADDVLYTLIAITEVISIFENLSSICEKTNNRMVRVVKVILLIAKEKEEEIIKNIEEKLKKGGKDEEKKEKDNPT